MEAVAALVGVALGAVLGAVLGHVFAGIQASRASRDRWAERTSEALADVSLHLTDTQPHRVTMSLDPDTVLDRISLWREQGVPIRQQIAVLRHGHPDAEVRELARELEVALFNTVTNLGWLVRDMLAHRDFDESLEVASKTHTEALSLADAITERIHE